MKNIIVSILVFVSLTSSAMSLGERADSAYNKENYAEAIDLYRQSILHEGVSSDVYYNLGNAYYRNDRIGMAVVCYERALRLDPTDEDARTNLDFVRSRIQDRPEDDTAFLSSVHHSVMGSMKANTWAWTSFVLFLLLMGAIATYIFSQRITLRKVGFFGGLTLIFLFGYSTFMAFESYSFAVSHNEAVVIKPSTQLTSSPRAAKSSTDKVVTIHEGSKVEIIDSIATPDDPQSSKWYNVKINNSAKAWIRASDVEKI